MAPKINESASQQARPCRSILLHRVDRLDVYRSARRDGVTVLVPHQPVIACYDSPAQHQSGRWVWAVCLGPEVGGGVVRSLALRRYCFPGRGDRRFRWLYRGEWDGPEGRCRLGRLARDMQRQLEESVALTIGPGALVYLAGPGEPLIRPHRHDRVGSDDIVLVLAAEVAACRYQDS